MAKIDTNKIIELKETAGLEKATATSASYLRTFEADRGVHFTLAVSPPPKSTITYGTEGTTNPDLKSKNLVGDATFYGHKSGGASVQSDKFEADLAGVQQDKNFKRIAALTEKAIVPAVPFGERVGMKKSLEETDLGNFIKLPKAGSGADFKPHSLASARASVERAAA
jgi:hypothetical protein